MNVFRIAEYIFPPRCVCCSKLLPAGVPVYLCGSCAEEIEFYNNRINPLGLPENLECYCDGVVCVGVYSGALKNSLKKFKFSNKPSNYRVYGKLLAMKIQRIIRLSDIDLIVPVPLHKSKYRQRGYNQAELIAVGMARELKIPCAPDILVKSAETRSQSSLPKGERLTNVEDSFKVNKGNGVCKKNILLVDDIITTGSTVNQCSRALKQAGAGNVIAGVIATTRRG